MEYKSFQGTSVPSIGLGTWLLSGAECIESVKNALEIGYRHIDTAQVYENEVEVGAGIIASRVPREEIFLTTKIHREKLEPTAARVSVGESLKKLATDYIDLLLIHWPSADFPFEKTLEVMVKLKDEGKVRDIGVSNFPSDLMRKAMEVAPIFCNQVEYHPFLDQSKIIRIAEANGIMITAYSPVARGKVTTNNVINALAEKYDKSPYQVALRWLIQQKQVVAIPKAAKVEHRKANINIFDFELTNDEMQKIFALTGKGRLIKPPWAPAWD